MSAVAPVSAGMLPGPGADLEARQPTESPLGVALHALLRFRRLVVVAAALGGVLGLCGGLMRPNSYTSSGTLLLRSGARESETAESAVAGRDPREQRPFDLITNEIEILSHRDTFRRVVQKLGVDQILEVCDPAAEDDADTSLLARCLHRVQSWWFASASGALATATPERRECFALQTLTKTLDLGAVGTNLIKVSYQAHSAQLAKTITDAFLAAAKEHHRQVFSNSTSLDFLSSVERQALAAAKAASEALVAFKDQHKVVDLAFERTQVMHDLTAAQTQFTTDDEALRTCERRCESLRQLLAEVAPMEVVAVDSPPIPNPEYVALQGQLFTLQSQHATLRGSSNDKAERDRSLAALAALIAETEGRLRDAPPTVAGPKGNQSIHNPRYERLRAQLDTDELQAATLRVANAGRSERLAQLRARLQELEGIAPRYEALQADLAKHEADGKRFLENRERFELLNLLDEHKLSNLEILEAGDQPMQKSGPNRSMWTVGGLALGAMLGFLVAFARHRFDGSITRTQDLAQTGIDVIGVVPEGQAAASGRLDRSDALVAARNGAARDGVDAAWGTLMLASLSRGANSTIALVADRPAAGTTTLGLHIALRFARALHFEVLLVETNYHRPALADRLGLDPSAPGFREFVAGKATRADVVRATAVPGLRVVCAGSADPREGGMEDCRLPEEALRNLAQGARVVILDLPSVLERPEFLPAAWSADTVVPVFAAGRSTRRSAHSLKSAIESGGARVSRAILNRWRSVRPFWLPKALDL